MQVQVVSIGNSKGIRIPSAVLRECGSDSFELSVEKNKIVLTPAKSARQGWADLFRANPPAHDDLSLLPNVFDEELDGWEWK